MDKSLDAQADAFAQLLALSPNDDRAAFRERGGAGAGLFPHQIEGVAFLLGRRRAILADDMGLGKTRQAIVALRHVAPAGPYLVVCPASVKRNWAREINIAAPGASTHIIERGRRAAGATRVGDRQLRHPRRSTCDDARPRAVGGLVFDEAHYLKNHTSARSRLARQLASTVAQASRPARQPAGLPARPARR